MGEIQLDVTDVTDFMKIELPKREVLLTPWLFGQGVNMIFAERGAGKTMAAIGIACALATGRTFIGWEAKRPVKVLYIDGEMPAVAIQERLSHQFAACGRMPDPGMFHVITPDLQPWAIPDLHQDAGQKAIVGLFETIGKPEVIIFDHLSALFRTGDENKAESWIKPQEFALALRKDGISTVFLHHTGKTGAQRGTSRREDILDISMLLRLPPDYNDEDGARFEVHFSKHRAIWGKDVKPFEAKLETRDGMAYWTTKRTKGQDRDKDILRLHAEGLNQSEIADELKVSRSSVTRALKRAQKASEDGDYDDDD